MVEPWPNMPQSWVWPLTLLKEGAMPTLVPHHWAKPLHASWGGEWGETYDEPRRPSLGVHDPGGSQQDTVKAETKSSTKKLLFPASVWETGVHLPRSWVYPFILGQFLALLILSGTPGQATLAVTTWVYYGLDYYGLSIFYFLYLCV